jgi:hypothetical protein
MFAVVFAGPAGDFLLVVGQLRLDAAAGGCARLCGGFRGGQTASGMAGPGERGGEVGRLSFGRHGILRRSIRFIRFIRFIHCGSAGRQRAGRGSACYRFVCRSFARHNFVWCIAAKHGVFLPGPIRPGIVRPDAVSLGGADTWADGAGGRATIAARRPRAAPGAADG